ncbi:MAG: TPM domain-containing protein, partial [Gemmatimonadales bacterium]
LFLLLVQVAIPAPRGYVNDFAGVLDPGSVARLESVIGEVRTKTRGEIAVVTLGDIGDRAASDVAVQIGRQWGVGAQGEAGDPAKNLGAVILLVPLKDHRSGTGQVFIATGRGAEGFLTDARVGRIRDAMIPHLVREDYGAGLERGVGLVAQAFADEFGVTLTGQPPAPAERRVAFSPGPMTILAIVILVVLLMLLTPRRRRRRRAWWWGAGPWIGGGWSGRGWGGGGGGGGGFGGFGGGGGFSGGGAGGRF